MEYDTTPGGASLISDRRKDTLLPNTFQTPNVFVDKVMPLLSPEEFVVLIYAVRRIYGFQKWQDRISVSQFHRGIISRSGEQLDYGTGLGIATCRNSIHALEGFRILLRVAENNPKKNEGAEYGIQRDASLIDWGALNTRKNTAREANQRRTSVGRQVLLSDKMSYCETTGPPLLSDNRTPPTVGQQPQYQEETKRKPSLYSCGENETRNPADKIATVAQTGVPQSTNGGNRRTLKPPSEDPQWEEFYAAYPRRSGGMDKANGYKAFAKLIKAGIPFPDLLTGVQRYKAWADHTGTTGTQFVKQVTSWLNGRCWEEDWALIPQAPRNGHANGNGNHVSTDEQAAQALAEYRAQKGAPR